MSAVCCSKQRRSRAFVEEGCTQGVIVSVGACQLRLDALSAFRWYFAHMRGWRSLNRVVALVLMCHVLSQ